MTEEHKQFIKESMKVSVATLKAAATLCEERYNGARLWEISHQYRDDLYKEVEDRRKRYLEQ